MSDVVVLISNDIPRHVNFDHSKVKCREENQRERKILHVNSKIVWKKVQFPNGDIFYESKQIDKEGLIVIIPSKNKDIWTGLENLLGLKVSGYTDTLSEAPINFDKWIIKKSGKQNDQQNRVAPDKFNHLWLFPTLTLSFLLTFAIAAFVAIKWNFQVKSQNKLHWNQNLKNLCWLLRIKIDKKKSHLNFYKPIGNIQKSLSPF